MRLSEAYASEPQIIVQVDGARGKSTYQLWLEQGNVGSEADYLASIQEAAIEALIQLNLADTYETYAAALADVANIPLNSLVPVLRDEARGDIMAMYKKTAPAVLTFVQLVPRPFSSTFANLPNPQWFVGLPGILVTDELKGNGRGSWCTAALHTNGNYYWRRSSDGGVAQSSVTNFYVDQVAGADAGNGTTTASAVKTLARLKALIDALPTWRRAGLRIGLKYGSNWRERFTGGAFMFGTVLYAYGTSTAGKPIADCSDIIAGGAFAASGTANVYQVALPVEISALAAEWPGMWEDGRRLPKATSLADCSARPGTFWYAGSATNVTPMTVYVHPLGSGNPATNGKVYEAAIRYSGFDFFDAEECELIEIRGKRNYTSYGSITFGRYGVGRRCETLEGNSHNVFLRSFCELYDHVAIDAYADGVTAPTMYILFENTPLPGATCKLVRCVGRINNNPSGEPITITGISNTSPATVTAPGHRFANNDLVRLRDVTGMVGAVPINGTRFNVTNANIGAGTFQLQHVPDKVTGNYVTYDTRAVSGYSAYGGGGTVSFDAYTKEMVGFLCHTGAAGRNFALVELIDCSFSNMASPYQCENCDHLVLKDSAATQFLTAIKSGARLTTVYGGKFNNNSTINGAQLAIFNGSGLTLELYDVESVIRQTGNIQSTLANNTLRARRCRFVGFRYLVRSSADNFTLEFYDNTVVLGNGALAALSAFLLTNATGLRVESNYNDFGGGFAAGWGVTIGATVYATLSAWQFAGYDLDSKG